VDCGAPDCCRATATTISGDEILQAATREQSFSELPEEVPDATVALDPDRPRRRRRRKRSTAKRFADSLIPFAILAGLLLLAAGLVGVVEHGAAASSKRDGHSDVRIVTQAPTATLTRSGEANLKLAERKLERSTPTRTSQSLVAYQLQQHLKSELGFQPVAKQEEKVSMDDVMDWGLIEESERLRSRSRPSAK
jgi:hypothetical protein